MCTILGNELGARGTVVNKRDNISFPWSLQTSERETYNKNVNNRIFKLKIISGRDACYEEGKTE